MAGEFGTIKYEDGSVVALGEDDAPELTEEAAGWLVSVQRFDGDSDALHAFLDAREAFLREAEAAGVPRAAFLPFRPNEPGFMDRAREVFTAFPKAMGWAAE